MGILKHKPFFFGIVASLFALVGLFVGFEVYRMPLIFWTLQNTCYCFVIPIIKIVRRRVPRRPACLLKMDCRRYDFTLFQNTGDLRRPVTFKTKGEYPLDYFGGFLVYNPPLFVFRVFHVAVWRVSTEVFPSFPFGLHYRADFLACIFRIPLVDDIEKRGEVAVLLVCAVNPVVDCDKPHTFFYKQNFGVKAHFQIVASKPRHIFDNQRCHFSVFNPFQKFAPTRTIEVRSGIPVVHKKQGV